ERFAPLARKGKLDGVEMMHPIRVVSRTGGGWRGEDLVAFWEQVPQVGGHRVAALGGSDYHGLAALGLCRTIVLARGKTTEAILEAIRAGRTAAAGPDGKLEGAKYWVGRLEAAGYKVRPA